MNLAEREMKECKLAIWFLVFYSLEASAFIANEQEEAQSGGGRPEEVWLPFWLCMCVRACVSRGQFNVIVIITHERAMRP